ncbi:hypothetical protein PHYC_03728 [Phycisphaerales bacterium]|nr:hypothetical protein PHYC_03728 [Phycisphaerales bacterium]
MIDEPNKREPSKTPDPYELAAPPPPPEPPKPKIGKEGLLEGFDEDADFERDPEVEKALKGEPKIERPPPDDEPQAPREEFVSPGRGEPEVVGGIGGLIAILALIIAAATSPKDHLAVGFNNLFFTIVHTVAGIGAIAAGAHLQGCSLGHWSLTLARVLLAVGVFQLVNGIQVSSYPVASRFLLVPAAAGAYLIAMHALFRWPRQRLFVVAACHMLLSFGAWFLFSLYAWIAAPTPKP